MSNSSAIRAGRAFVELFLDDKQLKQGFSEVKKYAGDFGSMLKGWGQGLGVISAAIGGALLFSASTIRDYSTAIAQVGAITGATTDELEALSLQGRIAGRTTADSIDEIGAAMVNLAKRGFSTQDISRELDNVANLADALNTEMGTAATVAGDTIQAFRLQVSQTSYVCDLLAVAALRSGLSLDELSAGLRTAAPLAVAAGASLKDTLAQLGSLRLMGFDGAEAGTALASAYKNLVKSEVNDFLLSVGVRSREANGDLRKLTDIMNDVAVVSSKLGTGARLQMFEKVFGKGVAGASALSVAPLKQFQNQLNNVSGAAAATAAVMEQTIGKQLDKLKNIIRGPAVELGSALVPAFTDLNNALSPVSNTLSEFITENKSLVDSLVRIYPVLPAIAAGLYGMGTAASTAGGVIKNIQTTFSLLGSIMALAFSPTTWIVIIIAALAAGLIYLGYQLVKNTDTFKAWKDSIANMFAGFMEGTSAAISAIATALSGGDIKGAWNVLCAWFNLKWVQTLTSLYDYWEIISSMLKLSVINFALKLTDSMILAVASIKIIWTMFAGWFERLWIGILDSFATAQNAIIKLMNKVTGSDNPLIPKSGGEQNSRDRQTQRENQIKAETNDTRIRLFQGLDGAKKEVTDQLDKTIRESSEMTKTAAQELRDAINDVEINQLLKELVSLCDELEKSNTKASPEIQQAAAASATVDNAATGYGASGSFLSREASQISNGGGVQQKILDTNLKTQQNTAQIAANTAKNNLVFV